MFSDLGIRPKIALAAALATMCLLSAVGALGYRAMVNATRQSQIDLLNQRLDEVEQQLIIDDGLTVGRSQIDSSIRIVREGGEVPPPLPDTLRVVRMHESERIEAIIGLVDTKRIDATLSTIRVALWISVVGISFAVGLTAWLVVGRALSPVRRLTDQAEANMMSRSMEPVDADGGHGEISQLASTFNAMLSRLRNADDDRRRFVSDASHELRTPLMVIGADAEYALSHPTDAEELAASVLAQTERLTLLVDDLLLLASLDETHRSPLEPVTVQEVLHHADAASIVGMLPATVKSTIIPNVSRSLANVVANARRHQSNEISMEVEHVGALVVFVVDDDGPGIPAGERDDIFKRFYRPDHDRGRHEGGAGLGLAIAKAEVTNAGGSIRVSDSPAGGARFSITVPTEG